MTRRCTSCGAELPADAGWCPQCLELVKPQGFFQRLLALFKVRSAATTASPAQPTSRIQVKTTVKRRIEIRDPATGESKVYDSLEEVPEKYREQLSKALAQSAAGTKQQIGFTGPDGVTHAYQSLDELPPEIRALVERAEKKL